MKITTRIAAEKNRPNNPNTAPMAMIANSVIAGGNRDDPVGDERRDEIGLYQPHDRVGDECPDHGVRASGRGEPERRDHRRRRPDIGNEFGQTRKQPERDRRGNARDPQTKADQNPHRRHLYELRLEPEPQRRCDIEQRIFRNRAFGARDQQQKPRS